MKIYPFDPLTVRYLGPSLEEQLTTPAVFYFSLHAKDSLIVEPYCQMVPTLVAHNIRVFSVTLPFHEEGDDYKKALGLWSQDLDKLRQFFLDLKRLIEEVHDHPAIGKIAFAGLSRGGFVALKCAHLFPETAAVLGFAPVVDLYAIREFQLLEKDPFFDWKTFIPFLIDLPLRIQIGNHDTRVHTDLSYQLIHHLVHQAKEAKKRTFPYELLLTPSIGIDGHGTSKSSFSQGAEWLINQLL